MRQGIQKFILTPQFYPLLRTYVLDVLQKNAHQNSRCSLKFLQSSLLLPSLPTLRRALRTFLLVHLPVLSPEPDKMGALIRKSSLSVTYSLRYLWTLFRENSKDAQCVCASVQIVADITQCLTAHCQPEDIAAVLAVQTAQCSAGKSPLFLGAIFPEVNLLIIRSWRYGHWDTYWCQYYSIHPRFVCRVGIRLCFCQRKRNLQCRRSSYFIDIRIDICIVCCLFCCLFCYQPRPLGDWEYWCGQRSRSPWC